MAQFPYRKLGIVSLAELKKEAEGSELEPGKNKLTVFMAVSWEELPKKERRKAEHKTSRNEKKEQVKRTSEPEYNSGTIDKVGQSEWHSG